MKSMRWLQKKLEQTISSQIICQVKGKSILLEGELDCWDQVVMAGKLAAKVRGYEEVVNHIHLRGYEEPPMKKPTMRDQKYEDKEVDVAIIGGGIIGCSVARELSKWNLKVIVLEKEEDVAMGASSRNDGMVHPGIDLHRGSKKLYYNSRGNRMYTQIAGELDVPFERWGSYILFDKWWQLLTVPLFKIKAITNDIPGLRYIGRKEILAKEKQVAKWIKGGIFMPSSGVVSPYKMTVAYAENAVVNGVSIALGTVVEAMTCQDNKIQSIQTNRGTIFPKIVVNGAGVYGDRVAAMVGDEFFTIHPRKGTIAILDTKAAYLTQSVVAKAPFSDVRKQTKGGGVVRTIDGNILVGPDANEMPEREDTTTDKASLERLLKKHQEVVPGLNRDQVITYFSGMRAPTYKEDFIVKPSPTIENLIYGVGIQSPGITAAPAIACDIEKMVLGKLRAQQEVSLKLDFNPIRKAIPDLRSMKPKKRQKWIMKNPEYGEIVCRCEEISKGEIKDAIQSVLPATSLDAIKRRVRPGMGRCQGGFCSPLVAQIIAETLNIPIQEVTKAGEGTELIVGANKDFEERV